MSDVTIQLNREDVGMLLGNIRSQIMHLRRPTRASLRNSCEQAAIALERVEAALVVARPDLKRASVMSEIFLRVVTKNDGSSWIYRDNRPYCGPFPTRESALATVNYLEDGLAAFPKAEAAA